VLFLTKKGIIVFLYDKTLLFDGGSILKVVLCVNKKAAIKYGTGRGFRSMCVLSYPANGRATGQKSLAGSSDNQINFHQKNALFTGQCLNKLNLLVSAIDRYP
jgi:hypothetical protein